MMLGNSIVYTYMWLCVYYVEYMYVCMYVCMYVFSSILMIFLWMLNASLTSVAIPPLGGIEVNQFQNIDLFISGTLILSQPC